MIKKMTCVCKPPTPIFHYSFKKPTLDRQLVGILCVKTSNRTVLKQICRGSKRSGSRVTRERRPPWPISRLCTALRWILTFSMMENGKQISEMPTRQNRHQTVCLPYRHTMQIQTPPLEASRIQTATYETLTRRGTVEDSTCPKTAKPK